MHSAKKISKIPKTWICPHYRKLPEFKPQKNKKEELPADLLSLQSICVCDAILDENDKLLCCYSGRSKYGKYFHLYCLSCKKLPNNSKNYGYVSGVKPKKSRNHLPLLNQKRTNIMGTEQVCREF